MSAFGIGSPVWKRVAKKWRDDSKRWKRGWKQLNERRWRLVGQKLEAEAAATRRKELLRRYQEGMKFEIAHEKEYPSKGGWIENRKKVTELMLEVEKELK